MRTITRYVAFDGGEFETADLCRAHEAKNIESRLIGLSIEQIRAAFSREDTELADAFEEIGKRCAAARREAGDLRRRPKSAAVTMSEAAMDQDGGGRSSDPHDADLDPEMRGRAAFLAGLPGMVPEDLREDKARSDQWLIGWDYESVASAQRKSAA